MDNESNMASVVRSAAADGGSIREAIARAAKRHQDPEYAARLDALRAEQATVPTVDRGARAERHHLGQFEIRSVLIEAIASHEVAQALTVVGCMEGEEMHPVEGDLVEEAGWP